MIEKDDSTERPESTQHPDTPPAPRSMEDKIDELSQQVAGIRQEISDVRSELSKLNQNHIDHLTHHQSEK